jgi:hypothetical protein
VAERQASARAGWQWTGQSTTKSHHSADEIIEIGVICLNLIEKSYHSSNPGQKPGEVKCTLRPLRNFSCRFLPQNGKRFSFTHESLLLHVLWTNMVSHQGKDIPEIAPKYQTNQNPIMTIYW